MMFEGFPAGDAGGGFNIEDFIKNLLAKVGMNPQTVAPMGGGGQALPTPADPRAAGKSMPETGALAGKLGGLAAKGVWDWLKAPPGGAGRRAEPDFQSYRSGERASYGGSIPTSKPEFWEWPT